MDSDFHKPDWLNYAPIAQLGERQTEDLKVACSIHALGTFVGLAEWLRRRPAKPLGFPRAGSNPAADDFCQFVRVVKEMDLKSIGHCPHRFESCS